MINLTNKDALYNFLSTFSGTHFVTPARVSGPGWRDVLNPIELRANDVLGDTIQLADRRESLYWMGADAVTFRGLITNG